MRTCYWILILWSVWLGAFFNCLVEIVVLLSTRHSCLGINAPFKRGLLKDSVLHFSTFRLKAKPPPSATMYFLFRAGLCCRCCSGGFTTPLSELIFQRKKLSFLWEISEEDYGAYCRSWHLANTFSISYSVVPLIDYIISVTICNEGLQWLIGGWDLQWLDQPFTWRIPWMILIHHMHHLQPSSSRSWVAAATQP